MSGLAWLAQKQLERAIAAGEFDDFEGKGKPFDPSIWGNPAEGDWAQAFRMLRQAGMAPRWVELDIEIRQRVKKMRAWLARASFKPGERRRQRIIRQAAVEIDAVNEIIETRNLLAPETVLPRFRLDIERELQAACGKE